MSSYRHRARKKRRARVSRRRFYVYHHWIDSETVYIGFTARTVQIRLDEHLDNAREGVKTNFYDALRTTGYKIMKTDVFEYPTEVEALVAEIKDIERLQGKALNMTAGGEGNSINVKIRDDNLQIKPKVRRRKYGQQTKRL